ncbi:Formate/nitrite family of transporters [hydrothermal vent metagenome]|uniref:Formate/nitrite family of transporters n=1 Tax=hydrothermal vent metagenome TaxID=652676 RepID=A0A3B0R7Z1_9ZZZZ
MTIGTTVLDFARLARSKSDFLNENPFGFGLSAMMAGAYVGMGILLIFSVGQGVDPGIRPIVMGASFGLALTLVVFAGSELFTGHTMYMIHGRLAGSVTTSQVVKCWTMSWIGNLAGAVLLATLFILGGSALVLKGGGGDLIYIVAAKKIQSSPVQLVALAMLCNWLVCLAIWASARTKNDMAKCVIIFWCLYAFIAAGFEHSIANMTVFAVALLSDHPTSISYAGALNNLFWVTLGNAISGAGFMGVAYWHVAGRPRFSQNESPKH